MERVGRSGPYGRPQVGQDRGHAPIGALVAQVELGEDLVGLGLDGLARGLQALGDRLVGQALGDEPQDLALAPGNWASGPPAPARDTSRSTISGSTTHPPFATRRTASSSVSISPTRSLIR